MMDMELAQIEDREVAQHHSETPAHMQRHLIANPGAPSPQYTTEPQAPAKAWYQQPQVLVIAGLAALLIYCVATNARGQARNRDDGPDEDDGDDFDGEIDEPETEGVQPL